ncbi:hypothetical protein vseg_002623 [Gypsophila vaccaria]
MDDRQHYHYTSQHNQSARQAVKFMTASTIGTVLLVLSALTMTGTVISLIAMTPLLVLFSPILVPALGTTILIVSGFVVSGGCGVAAVTAMSWIYQYMAGKRPPGADQLDRAKLRIAEAAREVKEKGKENVSGGHGRHLSR